MSDSTCGDPVHCHTAAVKTFITFRYIFFQADYMISLHQHGRYSKPDRVFTEVIKLYKH